MLQGYVWFLESTKERKKRFSCLVLSWKIPKINQIQLKLARNLYILNYLIFIYKLNVHFRTIGVSYFSLGLWQPLWGTPSNYSFQVLFSYSSHHCLLLLLVSVDLLPCLHRKQNEDISFLFKVNIPFIKIHIQMKKYPHDSCCYTTNWSNRLHMHIEQTNAKTPHIPGNLSLHAAQ